MYYVECRQVSLNEITFVYIERYDRLRVKNHPVVSLFSHGENTGMPEGHFVTQRLIVLSVNGHHCGLIKHCMYP